MQKETVVRDIARCVQQLHIDVLLVCPQNAWVDVAATPELVERTGLPSVAWFMDDYFADERARSLVGEIWSNAHRRFVISESMQERYSGLYGGECEVLNNSVAFPERFSEPADRQGSRLRIVYAGAMNAYYADSMSKVLGELEGLGGEIELDIYSPDELPSEWRSKIGVPWRHLSPIPAGELIERLQRYDVLLLLSSFEPGWRTVAETAQAGKMADYLAAGRCILAFGPEYAENVRYLKRYGIGEAVPSQAPGALREAVLSLAQDPNRRRELGERAYYFGREHRDKARNSARLWQALYEASESSPPTPSKRATIGGNRIRRLLFPALYSMGRLKQVVRRVLKG
jgi:glycosyltransferase involved in cell wall biosynthesis